MTNRYIAQVMTVVEVEAFSPSDAKELIEDCLHMEDCGNLQVVDLEISALDELESYESD